MDQLNNNIPTMTHPLSKYWDQPDRSEILIDDTHALMTKGTFDQLHEYSTSCPSGVYEGKMWRGNARWSKTTPLWFLRWYGFSEDPNYVSNNQREILIVS